MKKNVLCLCAALLALVLTGCGAALELGAENTLETDADPNAAMIALTDTLTPTGVTVRVDNDTGEDLASGNRYDLALQAEQDGRWYAIETGEWSNTAEAQIFAPGETEVELSWADSYGALPKGRYRVVKGFWPVAAGETPLYLAAEFTLE